MLAALLIGLQAAAVAEPPADISFHAVVSALVTMIAISARG